MPFRRPISKKCELDVANEFREWQLAFGVGCRGGGMVGSLLVLAKSKY